MNSNNDKSIDNCAIRISNVSNWVIQYLCIFLLLGCARPFDNSKSSHLFFGSINLSLQMILSTQNAYSIQSRFRKCHFSFCCATVHNIVFRYLQETIFPNKLCFISLLHIPMIIPSERVSSFQKIVSHVNTCGSSEYSSFYGCRLLFPSFSFWLLLNTAYVCVFKLCNLYTRFPHLLFV